MEWKTVKEFEDITFKKSNGVARIAFNRPEVRNAFRPKTLFELQEAFLDVREDQSIGVVLLSGEGPSPKDGKWAFCSGGDQSVRGDDGYEPVPVPPQLDERRHEELLSWLDGDKAAPGELDPADARRFSMEDVFSLEWASDPRVSPDGSRVVYVRNSFDEMEDIYEGNITETSVEEVLRVTPSGESEADTVIE